MSEFTVSRLISLRRFTQIDFDQTRASNFYLGRGRERPCVRAENEVWEREREKQKEKERSQTAVTGREFKYKSDNARAEYLA